MTGVLSAALEREHRLIDEGIEAFAASDPVSVTDQHQAELRRAITLLRRHIYLEEEFLFPPLRDAGLVGPVLVMVHEHGRMWPTLNLLEQAVQAGATDTANEMCRTLLDQLAAHNAKEERIVYPRADELLAEEELTTRLTTEQPPPGWVCQGAPPTA